ncbi:MAG: hypothetical protein LBG76_01390 [Treponema sp.]|jgi:hypothetical protein|nr:hypothetical protein [Treponema sp.]
MFGTFLKQSVKTLPFVVLFPLVSYVLSRFLFEDYLYGSAVNDLFIGFYLNYGMIGFIIALVINPVLLLFLPALAGGLDPAKKRGQFYTGFFADITLMLLIPIILFFMFALDGLTITLLIGLHALCFPVPFVMGALFVSPAYRRAFWFTQR